MIIEMKRLTNAVDDANSDNSVPVRLRYEHPSAAVTPCSVCVSIVIQRIDAVDRT